MTYVHDEISISPNPVGGDPDANRQILFEHIDGELQKALFQRRLELADRWRHVMPRRVASWRAAGWYNLVSYHAEGNLISEFFPLYWQQEPNVALIDLACPEHDQPACRSTGGYEFETAHDFRDCDQIRTRMEPTDQTQYMSGFT